MIETNITVFFIFIIGLIVGSFLNVMALRLLNGTNFIFGRSKCTECNERIAWYDNIPILSYILLMGKCRHCGKHISIQYPLVELITALLFVFVYLNWGLSIKSAFLWLLIANLVVITITDLREKVIFDINSIPLIPLGLLYNFFNIGSEDMFISAIIGAIAGAAFFEIFSRIGLLLAGEYAFGGGDTILGAALGAWFGWKFLVAILILSLFIQVIIGIPIIVHNLYKAKEYTSIYAVVGLVIALIISGVSKSFVNSGQFLIGIGVVVFTFLIAGISVFVLFKRMRETQNHTFLPFGPPLVVAGLFVMFFSDFISQIEVFKLL